MARMMTNLEALHDLLKFVEENSIATEDAVSKVWDYADRLARKAMKKATTPTKKQVMNKQELNKLMSKPLWQDGKAHTTGELWSANQNISFQKLVALLTLGAKRGDLVKGRNKYGNTVYTATLRANDEN